MLPAPWVLVPTWNALPAMTRQSMTAAASNSWGTTWRTGKCILYALHHHQLSFQLLVQAQPSGSCVFELEAFQSASGHRPWPKPFTGRRASGCNTSWIVIPVFCILGAGPHWLAFARTLRCRSPKQGEATIKLRALQLHLPRPTPFLRATHQSVSSDVEFLPLQLHFGYSATYVAVHHNSRWINEHWQCLGFMTHSGVDHTAQGWAGSGHPWSGYQLHRHESGLNQVARKRSCPLRYPRCPNQSPDPKYFCKSSLFAMMVPPAALSWKTVGKL